MTNNPPRSEVWNVILKTIPLIVLVNLMSAVITYFFYDIFFKTSAVPGSLAIAMLCICIVVPLAIGLADRNISRLRSAGLAGFVMFSAAYFLVGFACCFCYLLYAPMPMTAHIIGVGIGVGMTVYWMVITGQDVSKILVTSHFVNQAFEDVGNAFHYKMGNIAKLERLVNKRSPSGKVHMWFVMLVAPFSFVLGRILSPYFGPNGPLLIVALIMFPASQWLAGLMVRQYLVLIRLPSTLERLHGKPVILIAE